MPTLDVITSTHFDAHCGIALLPGSVWCDKEVERAILIPTHHCTVENLLLQFLVPRKAADSQLRIMDFPLIDFDGIKVLRTKRNRNSDKPTRLCTLHNAFRTMDNHLLPKKPYPGTQIGNTICIQIR